MNSKPTITRVSNTATVVRGGVNHAPSSSWGKLAPLLDSARGKIKLPNRLEERLKQMKRPEVPPIRTPKPR